jgi:hypothetical protein
MSAFNASKRKLTFAEERVLVDFILASSDRAMPPTLKKVAEHANGIFCHTFGVSHGLCQGVISVTDGLISVNKVFLHFDRII